MEAPLEQVLKRLPFCLKAGLFSEASDLLEKAPVASGQQVQELAYLRAWTLATQGRFDEAARTMLLTDLFADVLPATGGDIQALGQTERRRRAHSVLMLGKMAFTLGRYDEAATHVLQCLTFLNERRMNDPRLRFQALFTLGCAYQESGLLAAAAAHLQAAFALCQDAQDDPERPSLSYYLSVTLASQQEYQQAQRYAEQALQWSLEQKERTLQGKIHHLLGSIFSRQGAYEHAQRSFLTSLMLATHDGNHWMVVSNTVALAETTLAHRDLQQA